MLFELENFGMIDVRERERVPLVTERGRKTEGMSADMANKSEPKRVTARNH